MREPASGLSKVAQSQPQADDKSDGLLESWKESWKGVRDAWDDRCSWGIVAALALILEYFTITTFVRHAAVWCGAKTKRRQQSIQDAYALLGMTVLPVVVLALPYTSYLYIQGGLALLRLEEIVTVWLCVLAQAAWAKWRVYQVFIYLVQVPLLLAVAFRSFASQGLIDASCSVGSTPTSGCLPHGARSFLFIAVTDMTTVGNQFVARTSAAEWLTSVAAAMGILLLSAVLGTVISSRFATGEASSSGD
jgi:hypothetical protein